MNKRVVWIYQLFKSQVTHLINFNLKFNTLGRCHRTFIQEVDRSVKSISRNKKYLIAHFKKPILHWFQASCPITDHIRCFLSVPCEVLQTTVIRQCFLNFNAHTNHLEILLKSRSWFNRFEVEPKILPFYQAPWWCQCSLSKHHTK